MGRKNSNAGPPGARVKRGQGPGSTGQLRPGFILEMSSKKLGCPADNEAAPKRPITEGTSDDNAIAS